MNLVLPGLPMSTALPLPSSSETSPLASPAGSPAASPRARRRGVRVARVLVVVALAFGLAALAVGVLQHEVWGAPREVVTGRLVRSAQLDVDELERVVATHHVRRVISLRKIDPPAPEYAAEIAWLASHGIVHVNVALSPTRLPKPEALVALLDAIRSGPEPVLLHCEEGVDRTGLATVIWLVVVEGRDLHAARAHELSWRTGHVAFGQAHAMDDVLDLFERTSRDRDLARWIVEDYPRLWAEATGHAPPKTPHVVAHDLR